MGHGRALIVGIAGGSGSGKSWLARYLKRNLAVRAVIVSMDWYYRDQRGLSRAQALRLNVDQPGAIEFVLLRRQLAELLRGKTVRAPCYDFATHTRQRRTRRLAPAPVVILEGLFVLQDRRIRQMLDFSVFLDVPADVRLIRRVRRDVDARHIDLHETLRLYKTFVRPMNMRWVEPSAIHADTVWRPLDDVSYPAKLLARIRRRL